MTFRGLDLDSFPFPNPINSNWGFDHRKQITNNNVGHYYKQLIVQITTHIIQIGIYWNWIWIQIQFQISKVIDVIDSHRSFCSKVVKNIEKSSMSSMSSILSASMTSKFMKARLCSLAFWCVQWSTVVFSTIRKSRETCQCVSKQLCQVLP